MGTVIGELLPLALGVAISPIPIIAVILMLISARAGASSVGFLLGWVAGIAAATVAVLLLAGTADLDTSGEPSALASWIKLLLGALLLLAAVKQWRGRPKPGERGSMPGWMTAIDQFAAAKSAGLGFLLSAVNPKNLMMCVAAAVAIAGGNLSGAQTAGAVVMFTVLAASTVAVPVIAYALARRRMAAPLATLKDWLTANNATVMSVLLLVLGVVLAGKGLGGLL
ncbi:MAG: GAP family protein [Sporichthyaceae bacterium]|nr:GAP family protein [Sporichthyaceae bacterium]